MKRIILNSLKVSIAVAIAIGIANVFQLEHAISAGIVAVLSIQPTKRETINLAIGRLIAFGIALFIATVSYHILGFNQLAFWVYIVPYAFICYLKNWTAAIALNSVLVSHFIVYGSMRWPYILNEIAIFIIGISVGILMNIHLQKNQSYMEDLMNKTDEQIVRILEKMGQKILHVQLDGYDEECFIQLEHSIREAKNIAEENFNNQFREKDDYDIKYIAMRHRQYNVLYDMYKIVKTIETAPSTAQIISDYFVYMSQVFHRENDGTELLQRFWDMDAYMKKQPLPQDRQEFEDRARLFALMRDIEEFIEIKAQFSAMQKQV